MEDRSCIVEIDLEALSYTLELPHNMKVEYTFMDPQRFRKLQVIVSSPLFPIVRTGDALPRRNVIVEVRDMDGHRWFRIKELTQ